MSFPPSPFRSSARHSVPGRLLAASLVVVLALGAAISGVALAYDQVAILTASPTEVDADPGEEFTVAVDITADGHGDDGVAAVTFVAQYHPDYLEVTDVEAGSWLADGGAETDVSTEATIANADGTTVLEAERDPPAGGATGEGELATLTVAVAEDAPPANASIGFDETAVEPAGDWPLPVHARSVAVSIDGGGEPAPAFDHPDPDPAALETADQDDAADENAAADDSDATEDDPIPGTAALTTVVAALVMIAYAVYRRA